MNPDAALTYLDFVAERHRIWERRQRGENAPWTADPIMAVRKFTNVFRVLDPGSQFVFELAEPEADPKDVLMRLFLYRHTGRVEAWRYLQMDLAGWPTCDQLGDVFDSLAAYRGKLTRHLKNNKPWAEREDRSSGYQKQIDERPVFTGAYLVFPQSQERGKDKLETIVDLTKRLAEGGAFDAFLAAETQADRFKALRSNKGVGDFMSMQVLTDWGYTPHCGEDREDEFVVAGPGAINGAREIAPTWSVARTLAWAHEAVHEMEDCPVLAIPHSEHFERLRRPSAMDIQNTLCEFGKYARIARKPLKAKPYRPAHPGPQEPPTLPAHWL